jgi:hypothetical protein
MLLYNFTHYLFTITGCRKRYWPILHTISSHVPGADKFTEQFYTLTHHTYRVQEKFLNNFTHYFVTCTGRRKELLKTVTHYLFTCIGCTKKLLDHFTHYLITCTGCRKSYWTILHIISLHVPGAEKFTEQFYTLSHHMYRVQQMLLNNFTHYLITCTWCREMLLNMKYVLIRSENCL